MPPFSTYKLPDPDELTDKIKLVKKMVNENPELKAPRRLAKEKASEEAIEKRKQQAKKEENVEGLLLEVEGDSKPQLPRTDSVPTRVVDTNLEVQAS